MWLMLDDICIFLYDCTTVYYIGDCLIVLSVQYNDCLFGLSQIQISMLRGMLCDCSQAMVETYYQRAVDDRVWRCVARGCRRTKNIRRGSFFEQQVSETIVRKNCWYMGSHISSVTY